MTDKKSFTENLKTGIDEILDSTLKSRLGDPIIGTYMVSFALYNWQILIQLFSGKNADEKIKAISLALRPSLKWPPYSLINIWEILWTTATHPFIVPIYTTIFILFTFPKYFRKFNLTILDNQTTKENDRLKSLEKLNTIARKIESLELGHKAELTILESQISQLVADASNTQQNISTKDQEIGGLKAKNIAHESSIANLNAKINELTTAKKSLEETNTALREESNRKRALLGKNPIPAPAPVIAHNDHEKELLLSFKLDPDLILTARDFAENKKLAPDAVINEYSSAALFLVNTVFEKNRQSKRMITSYETFKAHLNNKNYAASTNYIDEMKKVPLLREHEQAALQEAMNLLHKIITYLT